MANYTSIYASGQAVDQALQRGEEAWTKINSGEVGGGKIEMLYNGTNITVDGAVVNFKEIVDYLTVDNKFTYLLYNNMAYLTTKIDTTSSLKQVVFESSHVDGGMGKIFTITVNSSDGVAIASINHTNVANENYSNKVGSIAENDKKSTVHYPSNKAVTDITDDLKEDLNKFETAIYDITGKDVISQIDLTDTVDVVVSGEYIAANGTLKTISGFGMTKPIHLLKGDTISASVASFIGTYSNTVAIFARYNSESNIYTALQLATDATITQYMYTATEDMDVVVSFKNNSGNTASVNHHTKGSLENFNVLLSPKSKWVCFGDSLTGKFRTKCIPDMMAERYNCTVYNVGFEGTRARRRTSTDYQYFDFQAIADAVVSGDYTEQENHLSGVTPIYVERLATLKTIDFSEVTNAYFFYGTNDFNGSQTVDFMKDALIDGISRIVAAYPNITPVLITPMFRFKVESGNVIFLDDDSWKNGADKKLTDYIDGVVEVGEANYIPVINLLKTLGITKQNYTKFFDLSDGTHPNANGIKMIGKSISKMLDYLNSAN